MDHVEIYNCSQRETQKAALRFHSSKLGCSRISNCSIYQGLSRGVEIVQSANIEILTNNIWEFWKFGITVGSSNNVTLVGNWIGAIKYRKEVKGDMLGDPVAGIAGCAENPGPNCIGLRITNNVVSTIESSNVDACGFTVQHYQCGKQYTNQFYDNIAHSVHGYGAIIFTNSSAPGAGKCIQGGSFAAYKCAVSGIVSMQGTEKLILSDLILIDNQWSAVGNIGTDAEYLEVRLRNIKFYGETEASECPGKPGACLLDGAKGCFNRSAIMISSYTGDAKPPLGITVAQAP
jgi:Periplasmic copper-binding protein (NosD)